MSGNLCLIVAIAANIVTPAMGADKPVLTTLYQFTGGADGGDPQAAPIVRRGTLYGTTSGGGTNGEGTAFAFSLSQNAETVLTSFRDGDRYHESQLASGVIAHDGTIYGTTGGNGTSNFGTVYKIDTVSGKQTVLYKFKGGADGDYPNGGVIYDHGLLFGTTAYGGTTCADSNPAGCGTVFQLNLRTGTETVLYRFKGGADGEYPLAGLTQENGGLYGTTSSNLTRYQGTVFKIDPGTGLETVLHVFTGGQDGGTPWAGLVYQAGYLYGATLHGGSGCAGNHQAGCGTVFKMDPATGTETVLHSFVGGMDGDGPAATLTHHDGLLYGATESGGGGQGCDGEGCGTVFRIDATTGRESVLHSFSWDVDGADPNNLTFSGGTLYGTTTYGAQGAGTIFKLTP
jgi:uncharacterized repeat protein (TIGR03803 family)